MNALKIDKKYLNSIADNLETHADSIKEICGILRDDNEDDFYRYIRMVQAEVITESFHSLIKCTMTAFLRGFDAHHESLQTKEAEERGWGKIEIEDNPFFENSKNDNYDDIDLSDLIDVNKLPSFLRKEIIRILLREKKKIRGGDNEDENR